LSLYVLKLLLLKSLCVPMFLLISDSWNNALLLGLWLHLNFMLHASVFHWSGDVTANSFHHVIRMLWIIWKTAEPQTTNTNRANRAGPTGYFSSDGFSDFGTFPLVLMFLECFSLAIRILCLLGILFWCL